MGDCRLTYPAECKTGQSDSELDGRQEVVQVLLEALYGACANTPCVDELLDARVTDTDNGELGSHKEGVERHQQNNHQNAKEHQRCHWWLV